MKYIALPTFKVLSLLIVPEPCTEREPETVNDVKVNDKEPLKYTALPTRNAPQLIIVPEPCTEREPETVNAVEVNDKEPFCTEREPVTFNEVEVDDSGPFNIATSKEEDEKVTNAFVKLRTSPIVT